MRSALWLIYANPPTYEPASPGCGSKSSISAAAQAGRKRRLRSRLLRYYHVETPVPALITEVQQRWPCCISGGDRRDVMGATCPNGVVWTCCNGVRDFSRCTMGPAPAGHPAPVALFYREVQRCKPFMMIRAGEPHTRPTVNDSVCVCNL